jgi:hypothetical protein
MEKMIGDVVCIINETLPVSAEGPFASPRAPRQNSVQPHPYISFFIPAGETGHLVEYLTGKSDVAPRAKTIKAFPEITRTSGRSSKRCYLHPTQSTSEFTESQLPGAPDHLRMLRLNTEKIVSIILAREERFMRPGCGARNWFV